MTEPTQHHAGNRGAAPQQCRKNSQGLVAAHDLPPNCESPGLMGVFSFPFPFYAGGGGAGDCEEPAPIFCALK